MPQLYSNDHLFISADWKGDALVISGHDLAPPPFLGDEYEYWITVAAEHVPALAAALGVGSGRDEIMASLVAQGEAICRRGERSWLEDHGVASTTSTWSH